MCHDRRDLNLEQIHEHIVGVKKGANTTAKQTHLHHQASPTIWRIQHDSAGSLQRALTNHDLGALDKTLNGIETSLGGNQLVQALDLMIRDVASHSIVVGQPANQIPDLTHLEHLHAHTRIQSCSKK